MSYRSAGKEVITTPNNFAPFDSARDGIFTMQRLFDLVKNAFYRMLPMSTEGYVGVMVRLVSGSI